MTIPFIATHVSGVTLQDDVSSAVPRSYIDTISSNIDTRIDSLEGVSSVDFGTFSATDESLTGFTAGTFAVSSAGGTSLSLGVAGYSTISSQAKYTYDEIIASGTKWYDTYQWFNASAQILSDFNSSGDKYTAAYDWYVASAQSLSAYQASGDEYSAAYASAQILKEGAFRDVATGWFYASDQSAIPHTLSAKPNHVTVTPSGIVTFATALTVDATYIHLRISAAGQRMVNWRAEV